MTEGNSAKEYWYFMQSNKHHFRFPSFLWEKNKHSSEFILRYIYSLMKINS